MKFMDIWPISDIYVILSYHIYIFIVYNKHEYTYGYAWLIDDMIYHILIITNMVMDQYPYPLHPQVRRRMLKIKGTYQHVALPLCLAKITIETILYPRLRHSAAFAAVFHAPYPPTHANERQMKSMLRMDAWLCFFELLVNINVLCTWKIKIDYDIFA